MKTSWNDLTLKDLIIIRDISGMQMETEDQKNIRVAALLAEMPYEELLNKPLNELREIMDNAGFLYTQPKPKKTKKVYKVNGRTYKLFKDPAEMCVAQYIDFQAIERDGFEKRPGELLSIILIPLGHEYNDGYDKELVVEDMYDLPVEEALGICDFFTKRYTKLISLMRMYLPIHLKWLRMKAKKKDKEMYKALEIQMKLILDEADYIYGLTASKR